MKPVEGLDLGYLQSLADGDEQFISEVLTLFVNETPDALRQMVSYIKTGNYTLLKINAHKIKSTLKLLGNDTLANMAQEIENYSQQGNSYVLLTPLVAKFNFHINEFVDLLKANITTLPPQAA